MEIQNGIQSEMWINLTVLYCVIFIFLKSSNRKTQRKVVYITLENYFKLQNNMMK